MADLKMMALEAAFQTYTSTNKMILDLKVRACTTGTGFDTSTVPVPLHNIWIKILKFRADEITERTGTVYSYNYEFQNVLILHCPVNLFLM
jgi:hypothetical protein